MALHAAQLNPDPEGEGSDAIKAQSSDLWSSFDLNSERSLEARIAAKIHHRGGEDVCVFRERSRIRNLRTYHFWGTSAQVLAGGSRVCVVASAVAMFQPTASLAMSMSTRVLGYAVLNFSVYLRGYGSMDGYRTLSVELSNTLHASRLLGRRNVSFQDKCIDAQLD